MSLAVNLDFSFFRSQKTVIDKKIFKEIYTFYLDSRIFLLNTDNKAKEWENIVARSNKLNFKYQDDVIFNQLRYAIICTLEEDTQSDKTPHKAIFRDIYDIYFEVDSLLYENKVNEAWQIVDEKANEFSTKYNENVLMVKLMLAVIFTLEDIYKD